MGVRGLTALIKKFAPEAISIHHFKYFRGSRIAIDTSILIYKFRYSSNSNPNAHINGFLNKCLLYMKNGIIPIFVLDGKPPPEKNNTLNKRTRHKEKIESKIKALEKNINKENRKEILYKIKQLNKQIITVTRDHHLESKELLQSLGFHVINSPGEAEAICAFLQKKGDVNFTYSDDTDVLVLGCKKVLRSNQELNTFMEIDLDQVLNSLDLSFSEFIDLCILCGCDYCPSIPRVNYSEAYKLIRKYKTIEKILDVLKEESKCIPSNFPFKKARSIFNENTEIKIKENINSYPRIDEKRFTNFLLKKKFKKRFIHNYINKFYEELHNYPKMVHNDSNDCMKEYFVV